MFNKSLRFEQGGACPKVDLILLPSRRASPKECEGWVIIWAGPDGAYIVNLYILGGVVVGCGADFLCKPVSHCGFTKMVYL